MYQLVDRKLLRCATLILCILVLSFVFTAHAAAAPPTQTQENPIQTAQPYAVGWAALAIINAGLAQGKNRSGLVWFLLSIFLGPIATFALVVFFPKLRPLHDSET